MDNNDIFVLVLELDQYQNTNVMDKQICGKQIPQWVKDAVTPFHHKFVTTSTQNDIITLFKDNLTSAQYTVITYADMPLLSTASILQAVDYCHNKNSQAVKLPRGWVFNTQFVAQNDEFKIDEFLAAEPSDYLVAFNDLQVAKIRAIMQERINQNHLKNGVEIIDPAHTYIDHAVTIQAGCVIEPNVHLTGQTAIKQNTTVLQGCKICDSVIGENCQIGPYAHLRPHTTIGNGCRIGNFVEIKRSQIGDGTKIAHMTYVGDSTIGKNCNIGCGVIFCNYDGKSKSQTLVGDKVFIGSNTCLIAPVEIGNQAFIAAGSVISEKLPPKALGIARARQAIKENYVTE